MSNISRVFLSWLWLTLLATAPASGTDGVPARRLAGPVPAEIIRVIDGDTIEVRAQVWIGQEIVVRVRLAGVDAPELRARCAEEREAAVAARQLVVSETEAGRVLLYDIKGDKYFGRVVARVVTPEGADLSRRLLETGLGVPYAGGRRVSACYGDRLC
jgi:micrococcal nuclease